MPASSSHRVISPHPPAGILESSHKFRKQLKKKQSSLKWQHHSINISFWERRIIKVIDWPFRQTEKLNSVWFFLLKFTAKIMVTQMVGKHIWKPLIRLHFKQDMSIIMRRDAVKHRTLFSKRRLQSRSSDMFFVRPLGKRKKSWPLSFLGDINNFASATRILLQWTSHADPRFTRGLKKLFR